MNDEAVNPVEKKKIINPPRGVARRPKTTNRFSFEFKRRAVGLFLEEGFTRGAIAGELGISIGTLDRWVDRYRQMGEQGLHDQATGPHPREPKIPPAVTSKILELKKENPGFGVKRISQWLRRVFFLQASAETVRAKLHQAGLMSQKPAPKKRNLTRPRFFERATPNQMWQSDIFTFRLGGRYAYIIAFLDDYSRFVVGADLFRSPTAEAVIEDCRVQTAQRDAHRQWPPVHHLARHFPLRGRAAQGWGGALQEPAAASDDVGQDRALLGKPLAGVPHSGAVRFLRERARADQNLDQILQPQAPASGHRRALPGRSLL
jgi:transposase